MVWFYLLNYGLKYVFEEYFQSHYGLILSNKPLSPNEIALKTFQSHYGLILSNTNT